MPNKKSIFLNSPLTYYCSIVAILLVWLWFYAPFNYFNFDSDSAIQVLMSKDFQLPRDLYYWGQNRLGSLLPMLAYGLLKILPIHPLYVCSLIQFLFLFIGALFLTSFISDKRLKIVLYALIFLPVNEYNALILIGHPYAAQLFIGSISMWSYSLLNSYTQKYKEDEFRFKQFNITFLLLVMTTLFFGLGIWVSEFNAVLAIIPMYVFFKDKNSREFWLNKLKSGWIYLLEVLFVIMAFVSIVILKKLKSFSADDAIYDKVFIDTLEGLKQNFLFFIEKLSAALLFKDQLIIENIFNWFLLFSVIFLIVFTWKKKGEELREMQNFRNAVLLTVIISIILLFISAWNLRSQFSPKYFTPVYILFFFYFLLKLNSLNVSVLVKNGISLILVTICLSFCIKRAVEFGRETPFEKFGEFNSLPSGTLIAGYWDAYKINAIAIDSLNALAFENEYVRNWDWKQIPMNADRFYFISDQISSQEKIKDTIFQFGYFLKFDEKKYKCNNYEVLQYSKLYLKQKLKFVIKCSNGSYISIDDRDNVLVHSETDFAKASVFEMCLFQNGWKALKASNGKFVTVLQKEPFKLSANSDNAWGGELFNFQQIENNQFAIKQMNGTYFCADRNTSVIVANRTEVGEWEKFWLIPQY